jgi:hypothetical protein
MFFIMKKKISRPIVDVNTKLPTSLNPDDALKFKLAVATRLIEKKEKSSLLASFIKQQMKDDIE